jgi:hypothetical protein
MITFDGVIPRSAAHHLHLANVPRDEEALLFFPLFLDHIPKEILRATGPERELPVALRASFSE